ncbi:hypothetical protein ACFE04_021899 [Oxalis oulophora]
MAAYSSSSSTIIKAQNPLFLHSKPLFSIPNSSNNLPFTSPPLPSSSSTIRCVSVSSTTTTTTTTIDTVHQMAQRPDSFGRFGKFGGKYVPETLMHALSELETAFNALATDEAFQGESPLLCGATY